MPKLFLSFIVACSFAADLQAKVTVDKMFSDHMVLQRDLQVPVWGIAEPGEKVVVSFKDKSATATADQKGHWIVKIGPFSVGEPGTLTVKGSSEVVFKDVLVGEVWVGSGQSNMAGGSGGYAKNDKVLAAWVEGGPYPAIRLYQGAWKPASPDAIRRFSALHFSFGYALQQSLDVPVGLMVGAVGGTPSGRWLSKEMAEADAGLMAQMDAGRIKQEEQYKAALAKWEAQSEKAKTAGRKPPRKPRGPIKIGDLYERHLEPFVPYGMRGVLWDQGESRTQLPGVDQYTAMRALITGWRKVWDQGDFYFLHVQKPSGGGCAFDPENPVNRKAHSFKPLPAKPSGTKDALAYPLNHIKIATLKHAPLVTAVDLAPGIHPSTKSAYGQRACRVALGAVYGKEVAICGPVYDAHKVEGSSVRVSYTHTGKGLVFKHGDALQGFELAGADGAFVWADAKIDGDTVVVSSPSIEQPKAVRYAFHKTPNYANLFNKDGLPALTFTTE